MDAITLQRIETAHPDLRAKLKKDYIDANNKLGKGSRLRFAYVYRTAEEQTALYALGRTVVNPIGKSKKKPMGNIVTNAKAWSSIHNFGLAFDIVLLYDNNGDGIFEEASYDQRKDFDKDGIADWKEMVDFFKSRGYVWGGDWTSFVDLPHFEVTYGFTTAQLRSRVSSQNTIINNGKVYPKLK